MSSWYLSIAGSTHSTEFHVTDEKGKYVGYLKLPGIHARETDSLALSKKLRTYLSIFSNNLKVTLGHLTSNCAKIAFCVSGTDHRFFNSNSILFAQLRDLGFSEKSIFLCRGISEACYRAVLDDMPGIVIRAGTGSSIFAVNSAGKFHLGSAWASFLGSQGTSYNLGQEVLHTLTRTADDIASREEQNIAKTALDLAGCASVEKYFSKIHNICISGGAASLLEEIGKLSNAVFLEAKKGNFTANTILDNSRSHLCEVAKKIITKLHMDNDPFSVVFSGNLFESHPAFAKKTFQGLKEYCKNLTYINVDQQYFSRAVGASKILHSDVDLYKKNKVVQIMIENHKYIDNKDIYWKPIKLEGI